MWNKMDKIIVILLVILAILQFFMGILNHFAVNINKFVDYTRSELRSVFFLWGLIGIGMELLIIAILIIMIRKE